MCILIYSIDSKALLSARNSKPEIILLSSRMLWNTEKQNINTKVNLCTVKAWVFFVICMTLSSSKLYPKCPVILSHSFLRLETDSL